MLSKYELNLILQFLDDYDDRLSNDGCNDYELEENDDTKILIEDVQRWLQDPDLHIKPNNGKYQLQNWMIVGALKDKIKQYLKEVDCG